MEHVIVEFDEERDVYVDAQRNGKTNQMLRLGAGTHTFSLSDPQNYSPTEITEEIKDSSVLDPYIIRFTRNS